MNKYFFIGLLVSVLIGAGDMWSLSLLMAPGIFLVASAIVLGIAKLNTNFDVSGRDYD